MGGGIGYILQESDAIYKRCPSSIVNRYLAKLLSYLLWKNLKNHPSVDHIEFTKTLMLSVEYAD